MAFLLHKDENGAETYGTFSVFPESSVVHAVSTRYGGVSRPPYDSMNLALQVGDDAADVVENRRRFLGKLGLDFERLTTPEQIHGDRIVRIGEENAGRGRLSYADAIPATDALMTDVPGVPLMLCFADCTPILFFDPVHRAAAIAHGGWKGTVRSIAVKTVRAMADAFGTRPEDCMAAIGPAIGSCCYAVGGEVAEEYRKAFPQFAEHILSEENGTIRLDLWQANRLQLEDAGLLAAHIDTADACTSCHARTFFSYRAEGPTTGRIAAVMAIR
ncbi:MAG: peptidoglycan editing factor PgeF [Schwartzia succinivorans]|nr:peptidoglycan editing factor PgeF [Schwartzia succinivorans]